MAPLAQHIEDCVRWLGVGQEEVHRWLDEFMQTDGALHRKHRHHLEGIEQAKRLFGDVGRDAAIVHILRDCRNIPKMGDYATGVVDPLGLPKTWPIAAYSRYTEEAFAALVQHRLHGPAGIILCGFIGQEMPAFLSSVAAVSQERIKELTPQIEAATKHRSELLPLEPSGLPRAISNNDVRAYVQQLESQPLFAEIQAQLGKLEVGYLPVSALVTPLPVIDFEYVETLRAELAGDDEVSVARFVVPELINVPVRAGVDLANRRVFFVSTNKTLTLGKMHVQPLPDGNAEVRVTVTNAATFVIASRVGDRFYLRSGTHRAYLLASMGAKEIPCITVIENQVPILAGGYPSFSPAVLTQPRPPLLQDYFDERLSITVPLQRTNKLIQISAEELIIPVD